MSATSSMKIIFSDIAAKSIP